MIYKTARRMSEMKASEIREILKVAERPEVISFAGGLPAPELFPIEEIKRVSRLVLEESGEKALQYSITEGFTPLREWISERMNRRLGTSFDADNVLITHGSQQALDLSGKVFLDEGDRVLCESPTYLAAISAFKAYGACFTEIRTDENGMLPDDLEEQLQRHPETKLIYVIPDFQNPTGRTWSLERRRQLVEISARYEVAVVEDNPYGELRFEGEFLPSIKSLDQTGNVLCTGTFSKILCPGYRIGWIAGEKDIIGKYVLAKQAVDLHSNTLAQREIAKYLELYDIDAHIETIRETYRKRCNLAMETMTSAFPSGVTFTKPEGGLFLWVELPETVNAREVLEACLAQNVAFVPGGPFFPNGGRENTLRINYSNMPDDRIVEGLGRIGQVLRGFVGA